jgi:hypothetical protein
MQKVWWHIKRHSPLGTDGFSVVEALLAATVLAALATAMVGAMVYGRAATGGAGDRVRAVFLAEEGVEAFRNIGAAAYANLVNGTHGLTQSGAPLVWATSGTSDTSGIYTRQTVIADGGTNRKNVTSTVTWPQQGSSTGSTSVITRLTNWRANITQWSAGAVAGSINVTGTNNAIKTATVGNYAYTVLNAAASNFNVVNISNPASPTNTATVTIAGTPTNIFVSGNYAYVTNQSDTAELQVVDITNPASPSVVASVNMTGTGNGLGVYVSGNFAYVGRVSDATVGANELTIVNITNPLSPSVSGGYNNAINMNEVYVSGTNAYVATSNTAGEMIVVNVTNPAAPTLAATYNAATAVAALTITGYSNRVLLGTSTNLLAINITTPTSPALLGTFAAGGTVNDVEVDITQTFAFIGTSSTTAEFRVVGITNPASMTAVRTVDVTGTTSTITGVSYNTSLDVVVGASASDTQEVLIFRRN